MGRCPDDRGLASLVARLQRESADFERLDLLRVTGLQELRPQV